MRYIKRSVWYGTGLAAGVAAVLAVRGEPSAWLWGGLTLILALGSYLLLKDRITHAAAGRWLVSVAGLGVLWRLFASVLNDSPTPDQLTAATAMFGIVAACYVAFKRRTARWLALASAISLLVALSTSGLDSPNIISMIASLGGLVLCIDLTVTIKYEDRQMAFTQEALAGRDELTGLLNRRGISDRLHNPPPGTGLMLIDLDNFKIINDTQGHAVGDATLKQVAEVLQRHLRGLDVAVRWGGDEFLVVLPDLGTGADMVAERLRVAIENADVGLTASIGVGLLRPDESVDDCLQRVDAALYDAKGHGRNRSVRVS